jgi:hypothetical protein
MSLLASDCHMTWVHSANPSPIKCCWPEPAQSFLVSSPIRTNDRIFVLSKTFTRFEIGHPLQREEGTVYRWSLPPLLAVTLAGTHSLIPPPPTHAPTHTTNSLRLATDFTLPESEFLYDSWFTTNQFILAPSLLRLMTTVFILQLNPYSLNPCVTSPMTRVWVCLLWICLAFVKCTCCTYSMILKILPFTIYKSSVSSGFSEHIMPLLFTLYYNSSLAWPLPSLSLLYFLCLASPCPCRKQSFSWFCYDLCL